jgi:hypothetical protein
MKSPRFTAHTTPFQTTSSGAHFSSFSSAKWTSTPSGQSFQLLLAQSTIRHNVHVTNGEKKSSPFVDKMMKQVLKKSISHPTRDPIGSHDRDNMPSKHSGDKVASYHLRSVAEFKSHHHRSPTTTTNARISIV